MKKVFFMACLAASMLFMSCGNAPEDKMKAYMEDMVEAVKAGDMDKVEKLQKEVAEWQASLSDDEKKAVADWGASEDAQKLYQDFVKEMSSAAMNSINEQIENLSGDIQEVADGFADDVKDKVEDLADEYVDGAEAALKDAMDAADKEVKNAMDAADKEMKNAMDAAEKEMKNAMKKALDF